MPTTLGASSSPGQFPLLTTKLYIPHPRRGLVARLRLLAQVEAALRVLLTLLIAHAGWGKTSVLSAWCAAAAAARDHHASAEPVAWVSLDAGDNDPTHFWTY